MNHYEGFLHFTSVPSGEKARIFCAGLSLDSLFYFVSNLTLFLRAPCVFVMFLPPALKKNSGCRKMYVSYIMQPGGEYTHFVMIQCNIPSFLIILCMYSMAT